VQLAMTLSEQPLFISYSRKDYYFAESLAFHLLNRSLPAWLDVKDLKPGVDWERDLEAAIAAASSVVLVASQSAFKISFITKHIPNFSEEEATFTVEGRMSGDDIQIWIQDKDGLSKGIARRVAELGRPRVLNR
jgi:hypothetical protein